MTDREFQFAAKRLMESETFKEGREKVHAYLVQRLLKATTQEDREEKWREIDALERVWTLLAIAGQQAEQ